MKKWHMIIGFPKTGSSWLGDVIRDKTDYDYFREYFCPTPIAWGGTSHKAVHIPLSAQERIEGLKGAFGWSGFQVEMVAKPWEAHRDALEASFRKVWPYLPEDKIVVKEVWSWSNIGFFQQYFNVILLHRRADVIFWGDGRTANGDAYGFFKGFYRSFVINADLYEPEFRKYIVKKNDDYEECVLGHHLATQILFREAEKYNLPVIQYEELLTKNASNYLQDKLPDDLKNPALFEAIDQRKYDKEFLNKRREQHFSQVSSRIKRKGVNFI